MSKATKRKHVTKEILEDYYVPENGEEIVKIVCGRGNNLHEVQAVGGKTYLVSMPTKFRRNVWVKRGDYVIVTPIKEGNKVQGEIVYILYDKQIKYLRNEGLWPTCYDESMTSKIETGGTSNNNHSRDDSEKDNKRSLANSSITDETYDSSSEDDDDLLENPNHRPIYVCEESSSDSENSQNEESDVEQLEDGLNKLDIK